jgi:hypothetical protein
MEIGRSSTTLELDLAGDELNEALSSLRSTLDRAGELTRRAAQLAASSVPTDDGSVHALKLRVRFLERERHAMYELLTESERHRTQLIASYVATYQLHATLDPAEVQATIGEIATQVLGVDSFVLLLRSEGHGGFKVALAQGEAHALRGVHEGSPYVGADPLIEEVMARGEPVIDPIPGSAALAALPLVSQGILVGVLVVLKLLEHRAPLGPDDRELLELIGAHAAAALLASRAFAASERKLQTLQGLVELARGR